MSVTLDCDAILSVANWMKWGKKITNVCYVSQSIPFETMHFNEQGLTDKASNAAEYFILSGSIKRNIGARICTVSKSMANYILQTEVKMAIYFYWLVSLKFDARDGEKA